MTTENDISLDDIKKKTEELQDALSQVLKSKHFEIYAFGALSVFVALGAAYLLGKRKGRRRN